MRSRRRPRPSIQKVENAKNKRKAKKNFAEYIFLTTFAILSERKVKYVGELAEWFKAAVLKTVEVKASGGSNPSLSAIRLKNQALTKITNKFTNKSKFVRIVLYWTSLN